MRLFRQTFLLMVGAIFIAYDEAAKAINEAVKSVDEKTGKVSCCDKAGEPSA